MKIKMPQLKNPGDWAAIEQLAKALGARPPKREFEDWQIKLEIRNLQRCLELIRHADIEERLREPATRVFNLILNHVLEIQKVTFVLRGGE